MFINKTQLRYELHPDAYQLQEIFDAEMERLFRPSWHVVGTTGEFKRDGDFLTLDVCGSPVIVHRSGSEFHAFLNVCSHRHCTLTDKLSGHQPLLKCQYHGWEYQPSGYTAKIPDAGCFRPFDRERARLKKLRIETCGQMLFLAMDDDVPDLKAWMGSIWELASERFASPYEHNWVWDFVIPCNWKVIIENTVESYHLPEVHTGYFSGKYPPEEFQTHVLEDTFSSLSYDLEAEPSLEWRNRLAIKWMGGRQPDSKYQHIVIHPATMLAFTDILSATQSYFPLSPQSTACRIRLLSFHGTNRDPITFLLRGILRWLGRSMLREVVSEDVRIFPSIQKGIESTAYRGCIGTREERVATFHDYLLKRVPEAGWEAARARGSTVMDEEFERKNDRPGANGHAARPPVRNADRASETLPPR